MKIAIIGGGPAGCIAAIAASKAGNEVHIYEKNEKLGKKLFITGKGRCNLTNAADRETVMDNIVSNPKFLFSSFKAFSNEDICRLIEEAGCPLKTERGDRVFPVSDHSWDVIDALKKLLKQAGVHIHLNHEIKKLDELDADKIIIATGGLSYPSTGSTGDGYRFAKRLGHSIVDTVPALVPLELEEFHSKCTIPSGLSLKNIEASVYDGDKLLYSEFGEMLFTHFGVSGPVILSASSHIAKRLKEKKLILRIDLKPALDEEKLDARILRDFEESKNKALKNSLNKLLLSGLIEEVIKQSGIDPDKKVNAITKEERSQLIKAIKELKFTIVRTRGYNEAIITQGGVSTKEIDPKTMQSKIEPTVYFAGEVIDIDAHTGGFNLQLAWSTGYAAGSAAAQETDICRKA